MILEWLAPRPLALERFTVGGFGCPHYLAANSPPVAATSKIFELKLHLLQQPCRAFGTGAIKLAPQLLNLELEPADERFCA